MKVHVDGKTYDAEKEPIMVALTEKDKINIADMNPECKVYVAYPKDCNLSDLPDVELTAD